MIQLATNPLENIARHVGFRLLLIAAKVLHAVTLTGASAWCMSKSAALMIGGNGDGEDR